MPATRNDRHQPRTTHPRDEEHDDQDEEYDDQDAAYDDDPDADDDHDDPRHRSGRRRPREELTASLAARAGLRYVAELTSKPPTGITSLERSADGWLVGIEVVEDRRIPSSADILAVYQAEVGVDGALLGYRRTRRYARGRGDGGMG